MCSTAWVAKRFACGRVVLMNPERFLRSDAGCYPERVMDIHLGSLEPSRAGLQPLRPIRTTLPCSGSRCRLHGSRVEPCPGSCRPAASITGLLEDLARSHRAMSTTQHFDLTPALRVSVEPFCGNAPEWQVGPC